MLVAYSATPVFSGILYHTSFSGILCHTSFSGILYHPNRIRGALRILAVKLNFDNITGHVSQAIDRQAA